jgi:hypothetical protein
VTEKKKPARGRAFKRKLTDESDDYTDPLLPLEVKLEMDDGDSGQCDDDFKDEVTEAAEAASAEDEEEEEEIDLKMEDLDDDLKPLKPKKTTTKGKKKVQKPRLYRKKPQFTPAKWKGADEIECDFCDTSLKANRMRMHCFAKHWYNRDGIHQIAIKTLSGFCYLCQQLVY